MIRTRLVWFALGAASVALVAAFAKLIEPEVEQPRVAHLELIEPFLERDEVRDEDMIANVVGELARDCGARFFETTFLYNDNAPTLEIALTPDNQQATECIMSKASQRSIQTNIIYRKATNAQTH